jgi:hypothetical protein
MKQFPILFIFIAAYCTSFAQNRLPIANEEAIWFMEYTDNGSWQVKKYINFISGDTIINHKTYYKLYYQSMTIAKSILIAGIRDDEVTGKTMAIALNSEDIVGTWLHLTCSRTDEFELYDFMANIGDIVGKDCNTGGGVVTDTSSIDLFGIHRKLISISSVHQTWYEGIGSSSGVLSSLWDFTHHRLYDYCQGSFEECGVALWLSTNIILAQERGKVFPNPTSGFLTVQVKDYVRDGYLVISDLYGQIVQLGSFNALEQKIDIEKLASGMYYVQVFDGIRLVYRDKVLLEK